jgi:peroxiredoxin
MEFRELEVALVSIAFDSQEDLAAAKEEYGIVDVPLLTDVNQEVSAEYDVLKWAVGSGEPSHTFVLVDRDGEVVWIRDYGSPSLAEPTMYVEPQELVEQIRDALN